MSLSNKALLIHVMISQWAGRRLDRKASGTVESQHETAASVGNYSKKLLPGATELERVHSLGGALRKYVHAHTLPWLSDGTRIISAKHYVTFAKDFAAKQAELKSAVDSFVAEYATLKEDARAKLGDLFNDSDYPSEAYLLRAFQCSVTVMPLPDAGDFRTQVTDKERADFEARMKEVEARALGDVWNRLHDVIAKATARLKDPEAVFRNTLISNITDLTALLPSLNVMEDPVLEQARKDIEDALTGVDAVTLRTRGSASDREDVARKLQSIQDAMSAYMGGTPNDKETV